MGFYKKSFNKYFGKLSKPRLDATVSGILSWPVYSDATNLREIIYYAVWKV